MVEFESVVRSARMRLAVSPAQILEAARTHAEAWARILLAMVGRPHAHLRTETDPDCSEFVAEVRRLRPRWIRSKSDVRAINDLRQFWDKRAPPVRPPPT
jgi:hypothetical protein